MKLTEFAGFLRIYGLDVILLGFFDKLLTALSGKLSALQTAVRRRRETKLAEKAVP